MKGRFLISAKAVLWPWALALCCFIGYSAFGLSIRSYDSARHDRFSSGFPNSPVANANFHADYYDFSGVGWNAANPSQSFTLISPRHFVGANHYKPGLGTTVRFCSRDGVLRDFTVVNLFNMTNDAGQVTDLYVGELDHAVTTCDNITFYPILNLPSESSYTGKKLLIYGKTARVGVGSINGFQDFGGDPITGGSGINSTRTYTFVYLNAVGSGDDCYAEAGDSGSPSFVATNGELFVVGVHTAVLTAGLNASTYDTFVPHYLAQIKTVLEQDSFQVATSAGAVFRLCYDLNENSPGELQISWVGQRHRTYQLEASTNLLNFAPISGLLTANVVSVSFVDSNAVDRAKFYRVGRVDSQ